MIEKAADKRALAKDYLLQIKEKYETLRRAKERYQQDHDLIYGGGGIDYSKEKVSGGKTESGNKTVEMMVDRWAELKELERDYLETVERIAKQIESVSVCHGREVLTRRYLIISSNGRLKSFETITEEMGLNDNRYTRRIHSKALEEIYLRYLNPEAVKPFK